MIYNRMLQQYKKTNVETASGIELVIMCYEQTIQALKQAKTHYSEKQYIEKGKSLQKALDIIYELQCSLDFEKGGQIAKNLDAIYNYITRTLLDADLKGRPESFDQVTRILSELKEAWEKIGSDESLEARRRGTPEINTDTQRQTIAA